MFSHTSEMYIICKLVTFFFYAQENMTKLETEMNNEVGSVFSHSVLSHLSVCLCVAEWTTG